nr:DNA damage-inducible protein 1 [Ipomoea batatas]GME05549.1 DNA damage-inducible protein 1 [Ipomoea batatas]
MLQTQSDHEVAQIFLGNDLNKLQEILSLRHKHRAELLCRRDEEMALLYADPFDVEAQKKIEEAIWQYHLGEHKSQALDDKLQALDTEEDEVYDALLEIIELKHSLEEQRKTSAGLGICC